MGICKKCQEKPPSAAERVGVGGGAAQAGEVWAITPCAQHTDNPREGAHSFNLQSEKRGGTTHRFSLACMATGLWDHSSASSLALQWSKKTTTSSSSSSTAHAQKTLARRAEGQAPETAPWTFTVCLFYGFSHFWISKRSLVPLCLFHCVNAATNHHIFTASQVAKHKCENLALDFHLLSLHTNCGTSLAHYEMLNRATLASLSQDVPAVKMVKIRSPSTNDGEPIEQCKGSQTHTHTCTPMYTTFRHMLQKWSASHKNVLHHRQGTVQDIVLAAKST